MKTIAVIGGTGLCQLPGFELHNEIALETPYGQGSSPLLEGRYGDQRLLFLPRHGNPHRIAPHKINYRANIWALKQQQVDLIVAVNAVGGINAAMPAGHIVVPDQIIDYTWGREHTYSDNEELPLQHIDFTFPYDQNLREMLVSATQSARLQVSDGATYAATQGPRLETAAEIRKMANDGCDIVGMTGMPEAALARELELPYAAVCLVVNPAAGLSDDLITMEDIEAVMAAGMQDVLLLLHRFLSAL